MPSRTGSDGEPLKPQHHPRAPRRSEDHHLFFSLSAGPLLLLLPTLFLLPGPVFRFALAHFFQLLLPPAFFIL